MEKYCPKCKKNKLIIEFCKDKTNKDGLRFYCKKCIADYRDTHKKEIANSWKIYSASHKKEINDRHTSYRHASGYKEKKAAYDAAHKEEKAYTKLKKRYPEFICPKLIIDKKSSGTVLRHLFHEIQKDKCYVCGRPANGEKLSLDHNHHTNMLRGWAHDHCNRGLLMWLDYEYYNHPEDREKLLSNPDYRRIILNPPASYLYDPLDKSIVV